MRVEIIDRWAEFDALTGAWDDLYAADEQAHLFVSWRWLRTCFQLLPYRWFVLVARRAADDSAVALLPLTSWRTGWWRVGVTRHLQMGGKPLSEYTGFLCHPDHESAALQAFARVILDDLGWEYLHLDDVMDARLDRFLNCFQGTSCTIKQRSSLPCARIQLAPSWEGYLQDSLGRESRRTLRKTLRKFEALEGLCMSRVGPEDLDRQLDTLLAMWQDRHGKSEAALERHRRFLHETFAAGHLWLSMAWVGEIPVAGLASFIDPVKKSLYTYLTAYNPRFAEVSPGLAIYGETIREAITDGIQYFDFLRGAPDYKTTRLGGTVRPAETAILAHGQPWLRSLRNRLTRQRESEGQA